MRLLQNNLKTILTYQNKYFNVLRNIIFENHIPKNIIILNKIYENEKNNLYIKISLKLWILSI